ncbi:ParA family protein [Pseudomarimonas arenosa]|uniref:ParA family protein n=1 Tax=Pseudomarimonas arenosa TaxID=2774145 RepID=A0AAW3ZSU1_9GAMM|nr:ParA family protein [Pseudomarimonas arenosa]MBD8528117.1 ParA family protein [Pseudomarimonas arenosa]
MLSILVASSKGGCGKSTLSTQLAAYFALAGKRSVLVDADPQGSSTDWCALRAEQAYPVIVVDGRQKKWSKQLPADTQRLVMDTPAGADEALLKPLLKRADAVLVPVLPSAIDLRASQRFLQRLAAHPTVKQQAMPIGLVANRTRPWTQASQRALDEICQWGFPLVAQLRDAQAYVLLAGLGKSLFDYHSQAILQQQEDWQPLFAWLREINRARKVAGSA